MYLQFSSVFEHGVIADLSHDQGQGCLGLLPHITAAVLQAGKQVGHNGGEFWRKLAGCGELFFKPGEKLCVYLCVCVCVCVCVYLKSLLQPLLLTIQ